MLILQISITRKCVHSYLKGSLLLDIQSAPQSSLDRCLQELACSISFLQCGRSSVHTLTMTFNVSYEWERINEGHCVYAYTSEISASLTGMASMHDH